MFQRNTPRLHGSSSGGKVHRTTPRLRLGDGDRQGSGGSASGDYLTLAFKRDGTAIGVCLFRDLGRVRGGASGIPLNADRGGRRRRLHSPSPAP